MSEPERGLDLLPESLAPEGEEESTRQWRHLQPGGPSQSAGSTLPSLAPVAWGSFELQEQADLNGLSF